MFLTNVKTWISHRRCRLCNSWEVQCGITALGRKECYRAFFCHQNCRLLLGINQPLPPHSCPWGAPWLGICLPRKNCTQCCCYARKKICILTFCSSSQALRATHLDHARSWSRFSCWGFSVLFLADPPKKKKNHKPNTYMQRHIKLVFKFTFTWVPIYTHLSWWQGGNRGRFA